MTPDQQAAVERVILGLSEYLEDDSPDLTADIHLILAALESAQMDATRLDFIERIKATVSTASDGRPHICIAGEDDDAHEDIFHFYGKTYRDAIDNAIARGGNEK